MYFLKQVTGVSRDITEGSAPVMYDTNMNLNDEYR